MTCTRAEASTSNLDLFDARVPFPHLLHVPHQLLVEAVRMLLQDDLQLEDLPDVRQRLTQDLVSVGLTNGGKEELMSEGRKASALLLKAAHGATWDRQLKEAASWIIQSKVNKSAAIFYRKSEMLKVKVKTPESSRGG